MWRFFSSCQNTVYYGTLQISKRFSQIKPILHLRDIQWDFNRTVEILCGTVPQMHSETTAIGLVLKKKKNMVWSTSLMGPTGRKCNLKGADLCTPLLWGNADVIIICRWWRSVEEGFGTMPQISAGCQDVLHSHTVTQNTIYIYMVMMVLLGKHLLYIWIIQLDSKKPWLMGVVCTESDLMSLYL